MASDAERALGLSDESDPAEVNAFLNKGFGEALGLEFTD